MAGTFQEEGISRLLLEGHTRCLGERLESVSVYECTTCILCMYVCMYVCMYGLAGDNISDLKAQVAANNRGNQLMQQLVGHHTYIHYL